MRRTAIGLIVLVSAACMSASQPTTGTTSSGSIQAALGRNFDLKAGQLARVGGTPITVGFRSVSQDSRCPSGLQCIWAGDAAIRLSLESVSDRLLESTVHTGVDPKFVDYSGYRITVVGLTPYPKSGPTIPADKYIVTLIVIAP